MSLSHYPLVYPPGPKYPQNIQVQNIHVSKLCQYSVKGEIIISKPSTQDLSQIESSKEQNLGPRNLLKQCRNQTERERDGGRQGEGEKERIYNDSVFSFAFSLFLAQKPGKRKRE